MNWIDSGLRRTFVEAIQYTHNILMLDTYDILEYLADRSIHNTISTRWMLLKLLIINYKTIKKIVTCLSYIIIYI